MTLWLPLTRGAFSPIFPDGGFPPHLRRGHSPLPPVFPGDLLTAVSLPPTFRRLIRMLPSQGFKMEHPTANSFPPSPAVLTAGVRARALQALQCGLVLAMRREGGRDATSMTGLEGLLPSCCPLFCPLFCSTAVLQDAPSYGNIRVTRNSRRPLSNNSPGLTLPTSWC